MRQKTWIIASVSAFVAVCLVIVAIALLTQRREWRTTYTALEIIDFFEDGRGESEVGGREVTVSGTVWRGSDAGFLFNEIGKRGGKNTMLLVTFPSRTCPWRDGDFASITGTFWYRSPLGMIYFNVER